MNEHAKDLLAALGLIAIGAVALAVIATTPGEPHVVGTQTLTFATLPSAYAIFIVGLSALLAANALHKLVRDRRRPDAAAKLPESHDAATVGASPRIVQLRTLLTLVLLVVYALLLEHLHFMLLTTLFLALMFVVYGQRSPVQVAAVALCGGASFYALFILALNLPI